MHLENISINELIKEAGALSRVLDSKSKKIIELETALRDLKVFFPHECQLPIEEKESPPQLPRDCHKDSYPLALGYRTKTSWYLAWQGDDENPKNFRIYLIGKETETVNYSTDSDAVYTDQYQSKRIYKKALIETDLSTKLRYVEFLDTFIDSFKNHLKSCRLSIESGDNPF